MNNSEISRIVDPTFIKDLIKHYFLETSNGAFRYPTLAALLNESCAQETPKPQTI